MTRSMTGYGEAMIEKQGYLVECRIKTLNSNGCKIKVHNSVLPLSVLYEVEKQIRQDIPRGEVSVNLNFEELVPSEKKMEFLIRNWQYNHLVLKRIKKELKIDSPITLDSLLRMGNNRSESSVFDLDIISPLVTRCVRMALKQVIESQKREASEICKDIREKLQSIKKGMGKIKKLAGTVRNNIFNRITECLKKVPEISDVEHDRALTEAALLAGKNDINEEIVRIESHLKTLRRALTEREPVGKKIDFILVELLREISTLNVKARDLEITSAAMKIKLDLDNIREQARNIM